MLFLVILEENKIDLYVSLPLGKTLVLHSVIILIKSVFNENRNNFYYNIFLKNLRINCLKITSQR